MGGLLIALSGCAPIQMAKGDFNPIQQQMNEFEMEVFDCEHRVFTMWGGRVHLGLGLVPLVNADLLRCMQAKGYREVPKEKKVESAPDTRWQSNGRSR